PLPGRAAADPDRRPVRVLRGIGVGRAGSRGRRLSADRPAAAVAAPRREHRGQPLHAGADAPDLAPRDGRPALRPGRQLQSDPLAVHGSPRRDPGQGVRARADRRRMDLPRPRTGAAGRARGGVDGRGRHPSGRLHRRQGTPREPRRRDDRQRPSPGDPSGRPRWPPAPQDHAAPRRRRRRWSDAPRRVLGWMIDRFRARLTRAPAEGWLSLFFVAILAVTVAWSLDDAALVLGRGDWTDLLAWTALGGVAAGFVGARVGWNRPVAHLI